MVVVNPRQVRDFAKATGKLAKTDSIDAQVLAHFGQAVRPTPRPLPDAQTQALEALLVRKRQVIAMLTAEKNRLSRASTTVRQGIRAHITYLQGELRNLDNALGDSLRTSPLWRERDNLLKSVPGVGPVLFLTILAAIPELDTLGRRQAASLVGVAPLNRCALSVAVFCVSQGRGRAPPRQAIGHGGCRLSSIRTAVLLEMANDGLPRRALKTVRPLPQHNSYLKDLAGAGNGQNHHISRLKGV